MGLLQDFKAFALRGNAVDLAIGVVIGAAFGKIVSSLVADVIMPPIGFMLGGVDFSRLQITLKEAVGDHPAVAIKYGAFLNTVIDFAIVAVVVFAVIKAMNSLMKQKPVETPTTKDCPECLMTVPVQARRCGHCGVEIR